MSRLAVDVKGFVVLGVYRSTVKKQNKEKNTAMGGKDDLGMYQKCERLTVCTYVVLAAKTVRNFPLEM